jgi:hypothetical protein
MKKHVVKALKWALNKFDDKTPKIEPWPFPVVLGTPLSAKEARDKRIEEMLSEDRPVVKKPKVAKATTRAKKPAVVAKTARTKKAK